MTKNSLIIRLTESVVFLRGSVETTVTGRRMTRDAPPAMLRGLLILTLDKPTKISSIEITLEGNSSVTWPDGAGARRLEITEDHEIFSATQVYFRAGKTQTPSDRRTASVGPGLAFDYEDIEEDGVSTEEASYHPLRGSPSHTRRISMDYQFMQRARLNDIPTPPYSPPNTRPGSSRAADSDHSIDMAMRQIPNRSQSWLSNGSTSFRAGGNSENPPSFPQLSRESSEPQSSSSSSIADIPLSRRESCDEVYQGLLDRSASRGRPRLPATRPNGSPSISRTPSISTAPNSPLASLFHPPSLTSHSPSHNFVTNGQSDSANNSLDIASQSRVGDGLGDARGESISPHRERGRHNHHARFSLAVVSNALLDAVKEHVRSNSPRPREGKMSRDPSPEGNRASRMRGGTTEQSVDLDHERGRSVHREEDGTKHKEKERPTLGRISGVLGLGSESGDGNSWKEFRKGTYTYPISFAIPGDSPPSLECDFGTVRYRLKAIVHRPGAFTHRLTASREVTLIASPGEDDVDETDNIAVQREWDSQMHYLITISGRAFPIGSSIPLHITFMPIAKIKIYRISALIEQKIEYYTQFKKVARAEAVKKFELLSCRYPQKDSPPILPLSSDYETSPLQGYVDAEDDSEAASSLMGSGPWSIQANLQLPRSCSMMHFTNRHKRSNIGIIHNLKIIFRVERGDDEFVDAKTGRRKLFDIVVQTPLHILSCRCSPEWTSLPRYERLELGATSGSQACPCTQRKDSPGVLESPPLASSPAASTSTAHHSPFRTLFHPFDVYDEPTTAEVQTPPPSAYSGGQSLSRLSSDIPPDLQSLYRRNSQFARLVAGEESESGEPPPRYDAIAPSENVYGAQALATAVPADCSSTSTT